ncbi:MAG: glycosyltransferase family 39 protein [Acidimicrobiales bacterium]
MESDGRLGTSDTAARSSSDTHAVTTRLAGNDAVRPVGVSTGVSGGVGAGPNGPAWLPTVLWIVSGGVVAIGIVLRFWTRSDLWLDEALTVDISSLPVHLIPGALRRDGAPPLYYVLLHFWMAMFGTSDLAVRSLAGACGCITLPLVWLAGKRLGGKGVGATGVLLVASSPFAVYYDTEARMYALVALLTVLGFLALDRALRQPRAGNLAAVGVVTAALLYTHYWALYLVGVTGLWLLWQAFWGPDRRRRGARAGLVAMALGALTFVPWLPIFIFQARHTGTPWAVPANPAAIVHVVTTFAGGRSTEGRGLAMLYFALAGLGLFGVASGKLNIDLDLRTRPRARGLTIVVAGTLAAAIVGGYVSHSAFSVRYASVVFVPLILLVAMGIATLGDSRIRVGVVCVAVVFGLLSAFPNITTNRTQAGEVAASLARYGRPGDVVAFCPDQLGPAVYRLLPHGRYREITFPRATGPQFVNWINYAQASAAGNPRAFAGRLEDIGAGVHQIWLVWAPGYLTFGAKCQQIESYLAADSALRGVTMLVPSPQQFYEPMGLIRFEQAGK